MRQDTLKDTKTTNTTTNDAGALVPLKDLNDFKIADNDPDVRGWEVLTADKKMLGKVDQMLVDTEARKVRYLTVELSDELMKDRKNDDERFLLVPIGHAQLDRDDDKVIVPNFTWSRASGLPRYDRRPVTRSYEVIVLRGFGGQPSENETGSKFYDNEHYDYDRFRSRRMAGATSGSSDFGSRR